MMRESRIIASVLLAIAVFATGCAPVLPIHIPDSEELLKQITRLVLYPDVSCEELKSAFDVEYLPSAQTPADIDLEFEEYFVPTSDGESINIWLLPAELNRGTVILAQGSTGTMPCYLFVGKLLVDKGWSVIMFDYRGFGSSSGEPNIATMHLDLSAVLDWAIEHSDHETFTLLGVSLGSLPTVTVAVTRADVVNGVVLDSPVAMGEEIRRFQFYYGDQTQNLIDMLPWEMVPEESVVNLRQPLLIFQSNRDTITPPGTVELFYERAGGLKELIVFPYLTHATAPYHGTGSYSYYLERFLARQWDQYVPFSIDAADTDE